MKRKENISRIQLKTDNFPALRKRTHLFFSPPRRREIFRKEEKIDFNQLVVGYFVLGLIGALLELRLWSVAHRFDKVMPSRGWFIARGFGEAMLGPVLLILFVIADLYELVNIDLRGWLSQPIKRAR